MSSGPWLLQADTMYSRYLLRPPSSALGATVVPQAPHGPASGWGPSDSAQHSRALFPVLCCAVRCPMCLSGAPSWPEWWRSCFPIDS